MGGGPQLISALLMLNIVGVTLAGNARDAAQAELDGAVRALDTLLGEGVETLHDLAGDGLVCAELSEPGSQPPQSVYDALYTLSSGLRGQADFALYSAEGELPFTTGPGSAGRLGTHRGLPTPPPASGDPDLNGALRALNDTPGRYTVAQVSGLRDGALVAAEPDLGLHRVSGAPWRDEAGQTWLDPTQETVQTYLIGLCRELADLGFDEILLTHCAYPTQGETDTLRDTAEREAALATFCRRLQGALADEDVPLSIQGQGDSGSPDAPSGQTTGLLATFGRVWAAEADQAALAAFDPVLLPEEP